jgi:hypothetical protein
VRRSYLRPADALRYRPAGVATWLSWKLARIGLAGMCEWRSTSDDVERVVVRRDYFFALRFVFLAVFFTADFVFVLAFLAFFAMLPS